MKKIITILSISLGFLLSNTSMLFADGYGHEPVDTAFVLDAKTTAAIVALVLFSAGAALIVGGKYIKGIAKA